MLMAIIITISLSACQSNSKHVVYDSSVDVPLKHWTSADTLFYPLHIEEEPNIKHPICLNRDYRVSISVRHTIGFPLENVPANLCLQQIDTVQGTAKVIRRVMQTPIAPNVRDKRGMPLGTGWGSLYEYEEPLPKLTIRFDQAGSYRFLIIPLFKGALDGIDGMASMGLELFEDRSSKPQK